MALDVGRCTRFFHKVIHRNCEETGDPFYSNRLPPITRITFKFFS